MVALYEPWFLFIFVAQVWPAKQLDYADYFQREPQCSNPPEDNDGAVVLCSARNDAVAMQCVGVQPQNTIAKPIDDRHHGQADGYANSYAFPAGMLNCMVNPSNRIHSYSSLSKRFPISSWTRLKQ
ncbi:hypothetical protein MAFF211471_51350 (plasmid) [Ralstonia solanacearum]|nr:hypothetical protein MAFF211471_51350 [Ralstonia solanacearum]BCN02611.1 hypothetical protein RPSA_51470 [Ralstonia solanacearum]